MNTVTKVNPCPISSTWFKDDRMQMCYWRARARALEDAILTTPEDMHVKCFVCKHMPCDLDAEVCGEWIFNDELLGEEVTPDD